MKRFRLGTLCVLVLGAVLSSCSSGRVVIDIPEGPGDIPEKPGDIPEKPGDFPEKPGDFPKTSFTVSFDKNNEHPGSTEADPPSKTVTPPANTVDALPAEPTRPGHSFAQWNTKADGSGTPFLADSIVTASITVYAQWTLIPANLSIAANLSAEASSGALFTPIEDGAYNERSAVFSVQVSGLANEEDANKLRLDFSAEGEVSWFSWQVQSTLFSGGIQTLVFEVSYEGFWLLDETPATLNIQLAGVPEGYDYNGGALSLLVSTASGLDKTHPIPVRQANIKHFNNYAKTSDGLSKHYKLATDVRLLAPELPDTNNWEAIGSMTTPFSGSFDGDGLTLDGLTIEDSLGNYQALFGVTGTTAEIKNLTLTGVHVTANNVVGSLVGGNYGGAIESCHAAGKVDGDTYVGGLVGFNDEGRLENCHATGEVNGEWSVGGLAGRSDEGRIEGCHATGAVTGFRYIGGLVGDTHGNTIVNCHATGEVNGAMSVGGLVGVTNKGSIQGSIQGSYATGEVNGEWNVGGLVGENNEGAIENCHATGEVSGDNNVGGLVGYNDGGAIESCYAAGEVSGGDYVGGLVGENDGGAIESCYAAGEVSGEDDVGGLVGENNGGTIQNCYAAGSVEGSDNVGGVVGSNGGRLEGCVALNPSVQAVGTEIGRVLGHRSAGTLSGNFAFSGMRNSAGNTTWLYKGATQLDGEDRSAMELQTAGGFPAAFSAATGPWTYEGGKLPGLFGQAVEMPAHLF